MLCYKKENRFFYFLKGFLYSIVLLSLILIPIISNQWGSWLGKLSPEILLNSLLLIIGIGKISDMAFHVNKPEKSAYKVEVHENGTVLNSNVANVDLKLTIKDYDKYSLISVERNRKSLYVVKSKIDYNFKGQIKYKNNFYLLLE